MKKFTIALAGNPNSGKTTVFNALTGAKQTIGNWPGVTVEKKVGSYIDGDISVDVVDMPGIYSFSAFSEDEKVSRDYILSKDADLVVQILDASNLQRNLYLTVQLIEMNVPVVIVLNMMDTLKDKNMTLQVEHFAKHLDCVVVPTSANKKEGILKLKEVIRDHIGKVNPPKFNIAYDVMLEKEIKLIEALVTQEAEEAKVDSRWLTLKVLESDPIAERFLKKDITKIKNEAIKRVEKHTGDPIDVVIADGRYGFIRGLVKDVLVIKTVTRETVTDIIDKIVINKYLGIPIFLLVMMGVFYLTMNVGAPFIDFFDGLFGTIFVDGFRVLLNALSSPEWLTTLLANGIGGGLQTLSTFIPPIFFIFLSLSILEDSGYMSRAAFIMDRFMRVIGLPGKAFIPMLIGFGCTVPAIMATRTLENNRDRMLAILMNPFMSCGARLPVYTLLITAFFSKTAGLIMFSIYFSGIILAILSGFLFKSTILQGQAATFVMELPTYHIPTFNGVMLHTWNKLKSFMIKAGKVILLIVILVSFANSIGTDGSFGNDDSSNSVLTWVGKKTTPIFKPMGLTDDNWPATVGLFTGIFAKEAVIGTMDALYSQRDPNWSSEPELDEDFSLWAGIKDSFLAIPAGFGWIEVEEEEESSSLVGYVQTGFNNDKFAAYAYLLFILIYAPCVAAIGAIYRETNLNWTIFAVAYLTILAWIVSTLFYQITTFTAHPLMSTMWIGISIAIFLVFYISLKFKKKPIM
ncbi:Fe(2+) transporter permease subunit FeoB [bacterium]|nr:Fe(2+) transporter permease subunit FeoB [bacterium]